MKHRYHDDGVATKTVHRDAHNPSQLYVETITRDAETLARNADRRQAGKLRVGDSNPLVDGDELTAAFSFPSMVDYSMAKGRYPDLFAQLEEGGQRSTTAGEKLSLLLPQYCTMVKRGDRKC